MEYWLLSAAPKRSMKCSRVCDRLPSQMASTCWPTTSSCAAAGSNRSGTSVMRLRSFASASSWSSTEEMRMLRGGRSSTESGPAGHMCVCSARPNRLCWTWAGSLVHCLLWMVTTCMRRVLPSALVFQVTRPSRRVQRPSWTRTATRPPMRSSNINASDSPTGPPPAIVTFSTGGASMPRGVSTVGLSTGTSCGVVSRRSTASRR